MVLKGIGNYAYKLIFTIVTGLLLLLVYYGIQILLLLFAGTLIAILWRGCGRWLCQKTRIPFKICLPLIVLVSLGSLVIFFWISAPQLAGQVEKLEQEIPQVINELEKKLERSAVGRKILDSTKAGDNGQGFLSLQFSKIFSVFTDTVGVLIDILLVLVFALFLVANPGLYVKGFLQMIPPERRRRILEVITVTKTTLFRWFIGKILDMFSIFILTIIGLWILDMPLIFTFALIAFFFSFIPNIGPIISVIPPMAVAFLQGPQMPLHVGLLYLGIQLFESYFITPRIQQHASYVPPVLLLLVQFLVASLMGILGLLLATPMLVCIMVVVRMVYIEDYLGTPPSKSHVT